MCACTAGIHMHDIICSALHLAGRAHGGKDSAGWPQCVWIPMHGVEQHAPRSTWQCPHRITHPTLPRQHRQLRVLQRVCM